MDKKRETDKIENGYRWDIQGMHRKNKIGTPQLVRKSCGVPILFFVRNTITQG